MTPVPQEEFALYERLVRIETKLDTYNTSNSDHESRLRRLERNMWIALAIAGIGGGSAGQFLATLIK